MLYIEASNGLFRNAKRAISRGRLEFSDFSVILSGCEKGFSVFSYSVATDFRFLFREFFLSKFFTSEIA